MLVYVLCAVVLTKLGYTAWCRWHTLQVLRDHKAFLIILEGRIEALEFARKYQSNAIQ